MSLRHPGHYRQTKVRQHAEHDCIQSISHGGSGPFCKGGPGGTCFLDVYHRNRPSLSPIASICSANYYPLLCHSDGRCCSMGLNATISEAPPWQRGSPPAFFFIFFFFFLGVQSSIRWQIGRGANQSGPQRDKDDGEGSRGRRMTCQMRKKTYWKGQSGGKRKKKTYWTDGEVQPFDHLARRVTTALHLYF